MLINYLIIKDNFSELFLKFLPKMKALYLQFLPQDTLIDSPLISFKFFYRMKKESKL